MKILKIEERTHEELIEIRKEIETRTGESKTLDQVTKELIDFWRKGTHTKTSTRTITYEKPPPSTLDPHLTSTDT